MGNLPVGCQSLPDACPLEYGQSVETYPDGAATPLRNPGRYILCDSILVVASDAKRGHTRRAPTTASCGGTGPAARRMTLTLPWSRESIRVTSVAPQRGSRLPTRLLEPPSTISERTVGLHRSLGKDLVPASQTLHQRRVMHWTDGFMQVREGQGIAIVGSGRGLSKPKAPCRWRASRVCSEQDQKMVLRERGVGHAKDRA